MFKSWRLGKLFDIPFYLNPTLLIIPALVLLQNPGGPLTSLVLLLLVAAVFGCVLLHELGHALMARAFGIGTTDITLYPIGGVARLNRLPEEPRQELAIALAGPAVNVVIAALLTPLVAFAFLAGALGVHAPEEGTDPSLFALAGQFLFNLCLANGMLVLFNLLPAFPMDGGRVLRALLSMAVGPLRATEVAAKVGLVMAVLIGVAALYFSNPLLLVVVVFVIFAGQQELFGLRYRARQARPAPIFGSPPGPVVTDVPRSAHGPGHPEFSGVAWDSNYQVWIQWHNGRPVGYHARAH